MIQLIKSALDVEVAMVERDRESVGVWEIKIYSSFAASNIPVDNSTVEGKNVSRCDFNLRPQIKDWSLFNCLGLGWKIVFVARCLLFRDVSTPLGCHFVLAREIKF